MTIVIDEEVAIASPEFVGNFITILFNAFLDANSIHVFDDDGFQVELNPIDVKLKKEEE